MQDDDFNDNYCYQHGSCIHVKWRPQFLDVTYRELLPLSLPLKIYKFVVDLTSCGGVTGIPFWLIQELEIGHNVQYLT